MSNVDRLAALVSGIVKMAKEGGKARKGTYTGDAVIVDGKTYNVKNVVPVTFIPGQAVYVQIDAQANTAYIIG